MFDLNFIKEEGVLYLEATNLLKQIGVNYHFTSLLKKEVLNPSKRYQKIFERMQERRFNDRYWFNHTDFKNFAQSYRPRKQKQRELWEQLKTQALQIFETNKVNVGQTFLELC